MPVQAIVARPKLDAHRVGPRSVQFEVGLCHRDIEWLNQTRSGNRQPTWSGHNRMSLCGTDCGFGVIRVTGVFDGEATVHSA